jgi:hypothetical protein
MKILSFVVLCCVSLPTLAIELYSCTDGAGKTHYTNLPQNSLGSDCKPKDHYAVMLQQDYENLRLIHSKLESDDDNSSEPFKLSEVDISPVSIKNKVSDIFDADKAFDELMEATEDRDDIFTRAIRGRTQGIKNVLEQGNKDSP